MFLVILSVEIADPKLFEDRISMIQRFASRVCLTIGMLLTTVGGRELLAQNAANPTKDAKAAPVSPKEEQPPAANPAQVASLGVFVGEWSGEINKISVHISAKWDANKKFLHRDITMTSGKATLGGTQIVGWDPITQQISSWMFSDDGSYAEGVWSLEGNLWMVLATRVLPDRKISQSTQVYKFPDKNTLVWKSIGGSIDGQPAEDFEVTLKRNATK